MCAATYAELASESKTKLLQGDSRSDDSWELAKCHLAVLAQHFPFWSVTAPHTYTGIRTPKTKGTSLNSHGTRKSEA